MREDPSTGLITIPNVTTLELNSLEHAMEMYEYGVGQRKTASTQMNDSSSRSHFVYTLVLTSKNIHTGQHTHSKISFVDLAGSEKVNKAKPTLHQLKEAKSINTSLSALKDVIRSLGSG